MTQPPQPSQPAADQPQPQIAITFGLQAGPDGHPWVSCTLQVGAGLFTFLATESQAEQLAPLFAQGFTEGAAAIRRARLGLVVPQAGDTEPLAQHVNGSRPA